MYPYSDNREHDITFFWFFFLRGWTNLYLLQISFQIYAAETCIHQQGATRSMHIENLELWTFAGCFPKTTQLVPRLPRFDLFRLKYPWWLWPKHDWHRRTTNSVNPSSGARRLNWYLLRGKSTLVRGNPFINQALVLQGWHLHIWLLLLIL